MHKEDGAGRVLALAAARCRELLYLRARFNMPDWRDHRPGGWRDRGRLIVLFFFSFSAKIVQQCGICHHRGGAPAPPRVPVSAQTLKWTLLSAGVCTCAKVEMGRFSAFSVFWLRANATVVRDGG